MATRDLYFLAKISSILFQAGVPLICFAWCLSSCAPMKAYNGAVRPPEELSIIRPDTEKAFTEVRILEINGYSVGRFDPGCQVRPGEHTVFAQVTLDFPYLHGFFYFCEELTFETAPGQTYTLHGKISPLFQTGYIWLASDAPDARIIAESIRTAIRTETSPHCRETD